MQITEARREINLRDPDAFEQTLARVEELVGDRLDAYERGEVGLRFRVHGTVNPHKLAAYVEHSRGL